MFLYRLTTKLLFPGLAESQSNCGPSKPQGIQRKGMQQLNALTFMFQRMRRSRHTLTLDFFVIPEPLDPGSWFAACRHAGQRDGVPLGGGLGEACDFWPCRNSCNFRCSSITVIFSQSATVGLKGWRDKYARIREQIPRYHLGRWGRPWWSWQAWWRASRCTGPRRTGWRRWSGWSAPARTLAPARFCGPSELQPEKSNTIITHHKFHDEQAINFFF